MEQRETGIKWLRRNGLVRNKRVLCLVDGEHYPPVTAWAIDSLKEAGAEIAGLVFLGGAEKISGGNAAAAFEDSREVFSLQLPDSSAFTDAGQEQFRRRVREIAESSRAEAAVDLSDDPVLRFSARILTAACFLSAGLSYMGADFYFLPPAEEVSLRTPSLRLWGTNKRVGKTAVSVYTAGVLKKNGIKPVIVSMGRGGPEKPELIMPEEAELTPEALLSKADAGLHAASDCWEDAVLARVPVVGCRRCGGGLAGSPFISNVSEGARLADGMGLDCVVLEGSGPTSPPVSTDAGILMISARIAPEDSLHVFGAFRVAEADLVLITMCSEDIDGDTQAWELYRRVKKIRPEVPVALTGFRIQPTQAVAGKKAVLATTASNETDIRAAAERLRKEHGCAVAGITSNLSRREELSRDLRRMLPEADILLTELKAAAVDVGTKLAAEYGKQTVFLHNRPALYGGDIDSLEKAIISLAARDKNRRR